MILRLLNPQGIAGIAVSAALAILLLIQRGETAHWKRESSRFEQLASQAQAALTQTAANARAAANAARASDRANAERVAQEQHTINERTADEYEYRLAAARARAEQLRIQAAAAAADPRPRGAAPMPVISAPAGGIAQGAEKDGLSPTDALTATEQAIQLDELIKWVRQQAQVDNDGPAEASSPGD